MIKIKSDKIIVGEELFDGYVYAENGKIIEVSTVDKPADESYDFTGKFVSAGFIDMHTHGAGGYAFMNSEVSDVINGCNYHLAHGTTTIVPTISAGSFETMKTAVIHIDEAKKSGKAKGNILGAHLEGPYRAVSRIYYSAEQSRLRKLDCGIRRERYPLDVRPRKRRKRRILQISYGERSRGVGRAYGCEISRYGVGNRQRL